MAKANNNRQEQAGATPPAPPQAETLAQEPEVVNEEPEVVNEEPEVVNEEPEVVNEPAPQPDPAPVYDGPLVVLGRCGSGGLPGFSQAEYTEGDIVTRPTDKERKLLDGRSLPVEKWWPGLPKEHRPVLGRCYPVLLIRPGTQELWVRDSPKSLRRLAALDRRTALLAIHRCSERDELLLVAAAGIPEYKAAAQAALAGHPEETTPVALSTDGAMPVVLAAGGGKSNATAVYLRDLLPLIETCEDRRALRAVETHDPREEAREAAKARLAKLQREAA